MRDRAIRNTHPTVVSINGDSDATDAQGQPVVLDEAKIAAEITKLQAAHAATQYRRDRVYPPIGDQLDDLFRQGAFSPEMAAALQAVKTAHPKGR
jgi:hypothetical protein